MRRLGNSSCPRLTCSIDSYVKGPHVDSPVMTQMVRHSRKGPKEKGGRREEDGTTVVTLSKEEL